jgi:hypothetical protein
MTGTERERNKTKEWNEWKDDRKDGRKAMEKEGRKKMNCFENNIQNTETKRKEKFSTRYFIALFACANNISNL